MDMEMDIPLAEELEWLESSAHLHDEEDAYEYYLEDEIPEVPASISDPSIVENNASRKRPLEDSNPSARDAFVEKRTKGAAEAETDEEWLRYSPPKNSATDLAVNAVPVNSMAGAGEAVPEVVEEKFLTRFASEIEGNCISVTGPCGERVYAKMNSQEMDNDGKRFALEKPLSGLLSEPIHILMERVEQEAFTKVLEASSGSVDNSIHPTAPLPSAQLWVDKYAPNSFTELLSDEQTNREVLLWLKQWDSCVFGYQIRATTDDVLSALRRHSSMAQHQKFSDSESSFGKNKGDHFGNAIFKQSNGLNQVDKNSKFNSEFRSKKSIGNNLSEHKVLLLCGPPGLGKTTLAHVAAKHCGYRVVEINASDDRSSSTIESKIFDAVQMNSVMGDSKPNCLVIDEIDGALGEGKGAVEIILKMVAAEKKSISDTGNISHGAQPGKASSKKAPKAATLSRPVICICNDLFAPALRPLRQVAKVHTFAQPTVSRVVNRLKYICNKEGFKTSAIALTALAEYTECDIRACLNTLQFLNMKKETLNLEVGSQVVGRKDMSKSVFDVWKEVFQKRKVKRERKSINICTSEPLDFDILYSLISNRGDSELIMDGIHENFLRLRYHDPMMQKTVKCLNALGVFDSMEKYVMRTQQMSLCVYQPSFAIAIRSLVVQVEKPNIEWPKPLQRCRAMLMEKKDLLKLWHNKLSSSISRHLTIESFVEDTVSPLLHILSPPTLRPVALHLLSEREKDDLAQLVDTMVSYSISYKNLKPDPQPITQRHDATSDVSSLSFEPPIIDFVNFKGYHCGHFGLSSAMKQILLHEVEKQRILRESISRPVCLNDENQVLLTEGSTRAFSSQRSLTAVNVQNNTGNQKSNSTQNQWKAKDLVNSAVGSSKSTPVASVPLKAPKGIKKPSSGPSSFFERFRKSSSKSSQSPDIALQKPATSERDSRPLLFKFNEGFTNAVKRPVRIRELLL